MTPPRRIVGRVAAWAGIFATCFSIGYLGSMGFDVLFAPRPEPTVSERIAEVRAADDVVVHRAEVLGGTISSRISRQAGASVVDFRDVDVSAVRESPSVTIECADGVHTVAVTSEDFEKSSYLVSDELGCDHVVVETSEWRLRLPVVTQVLMGEVV